MTLEPLYVAALGVVFVAALSRSTFGFGEALISMPLLSILFTTDVAAPWVALNSITIAGAILIRDWRQVQFSGAWRLILAAWFGIPVGLLLLEEVPESLVKYVLAGVLISFGTYQLSQPSLFRLKSDRLAGVFGFLAGILGGAYNTAGPVLVIYAACRRWSPADFRATIQSFSLPTCLLIIAGHSLSGRLDADVGKYFAISVPATLTAVLLGHWLHKQFHPEAFTKWVYFLLIVLGLALMANTVLSFP